MTEKHFQEAVAFLYDIPRFTTKNSMAHTREFLALLGNPQDDFSVIHVAGSNGKGSVCKFLNEMLLKTGKRVGLFTSPHLVDIRERFLMNGQMCSKETFLEAYMQVKSAAEQQQENSGAYPTFFEFIFAMGMVLFSKSSMDMVVLETGLGGRLDATNSVTKPILTIITSISLEHTEYLGDTIELVAGEKAGIIKPGVPVVFDANEPAAVKVIEARAAELDSPFYGVSKNMLQILEIKRKLIDFCLSTKYDKKTNWQIGFAAEYQVMNAALAITGMRYLIAENGIQSVDAVEISSLTGLEKLTDEQLYDAVAHTHWAGRMEEVFPEVFLDGAHNVAGITEFVKAATGLTKEDEQKPLLLFSMVKEKDYRHAIECLVKSVDWAEVFVATIPNQRGIPAKELEQIFDKEMGMAVEAYDDYRQAFDNIYQRKREGQKMFCTGSLYFIGALKEYIQCIK